MSRNLLLASGMILAGMLAGCADDSQPTTRPASAYDRSENALRDPFGYNPNVGSPDDITGGSTFNPNALKKDTDDVLNP